MNTKFNLASLKANFEKNDNPNYVTTFFPFWDMNENESVVVRFLPDLNQSNPMGFLVEKTHHRLILNGQIKTVPCLEMYGEKCPVCKVSKDYYAVGDKENGKNYWRKKQYYTQAIIIKDPLPADKETGEKWDGKVGILPIGFQIYNVIKSAFASSIEPMDCVPFDFNGGYDFIITKSGQGKFAGYANGTKFIMKQRALNDAELSVAEEGMIDLSTLLPKNIGIEKVQAMLNAALCGKTYKDEDDDEDFVPAVPATKKVLAVIDDAKALQEEMLATIHARRLAFSEGGNRG